MADESTQFILADTAGQALAEPAKRRFFSRRRKASTASLTHCENCGAALTGEYCAHCGQHAIDYRRSLLRVLVDAADSFLNWDTKFLKSVGVLLTQPGKLTNDFNAGRRVRYVHPLRLYLLASIAFFLTARLLNFNPSEKVELTPGDRAEINAALDKLVAPESALTPEQRDKIEAARARFAESDGTLDQRQRIALAKAFIRLPRFADKEKLTPKDLAKLDVTLQRLDTALAPPPPPDAAIPEGAAAPTPPDPKHDFIKFDGKANESPFGAWLERRIKEKVGEDGTRAQLFLDTLRNNIPTMMLCCIPLFAVVLKVLYFRQRRYYIEHLVYALHIHAFAYVAVVVITLVGMAAAQVVPAVQPIIVFVLALVVVAQVFLSIRRVYRQSWFMTLFKFGLGSAAYFTVLVAALAATAFATLLLP